MKNMAYPQLHPKTMVLQEDGKYLFIIPEKPDWIVVNGNTAKLLSLCNGLNSLETILDKAHDHKCYGDAKNILNKLIENNFFYDNENKINKCKKNLIYSLHLNMSEICNLSCIYCYADEREKKTQSYLKLSQYYKLLDDVYELNNKACITFTGGEPLLNEMATEIAKYCKQKNMPTLLLTNGTLIVENNVKEIVEYFDTIRISIDGFSEKIHEKHRGKGSYQKTMNGIALLEKYDKTPLIAMTVTKLNVAEIPLMAIAPSI